MDDSDLFRRLALALAIGFIIGAERGWKEREAPEGTRVAGIRTFALLGLFGGVLGALSTQIGPFATGIGIASITGLLVAANLARMKTTHDYGLTTDIAALLTVALGLLAVRGNMTIAAAAAAVTVALLDVKARLHGLLTRIEHFELGAAIRLLLISVVVLPLLPDQGYGPGGALNPYRLWWIVVIVASISFAGYAAVKVVGARLGLMLTGFFAGLASSTALTVSFARRARDPEAPRAVLAAGIAVATATMFIRLLVILAILKPSLALALGPPFALTAIASYGVAFLKSRNANPDGDVKGIPFQHPLDLSTAILFGALLAVIALLLHYAEGMEGEMGVFGLATVSGLVDVDALSISMANEAGRGIADQEAVTAIAIAAFVNTGWKIILAGALGGLRFGLQIAQVIVPALLVGGVALAF